MRDTKRLYSFFVYLTFPDPLRIQAWSRDDETKLNLTGNKVKEKK